MAGLCGTIGNQNQSIDGLIEAVRCFDSQQSKTYHDEKLNVAYVDYPSKFEKQPSTVDNVAVWCWGELLGHEYKGIYTPRDHTLNDSDYCLSLYDKYGANFVSGLNSEFSIVVYHDSSETVSLVTDRLGSRPIYYTYTNDGTLVFSSLLQSLGSHPDISLKANPKYLAELFTHSRVFGIHTPIEGVHKLPPASVVTFDLDGNFVSKRKYWWPESTPKEIPFSDLVREFNRAFDKAVNERAQDAERAGLLLSGGTDSRIILDSYQKSIKSYHMNEELNVEAQTAKRVAMSANSEFELLPRSEDYAQDTLELVGGINNFNSTFEQAHTIESIRKTFDDIDVLYSGHYSDTILGDEYIPMPNQPWSVFRHLLLPSASRRAQSLSEYKQTIHSSRMNGFNGELPYLTNLSSSQEVFMENISYSNSQIESHGVMYPSWNSFLEFGMIYPITNSRSLLEYETLNQVVPAKYPFLDNRVIDLALQMKSSYRHRRDLVAEALSKRDSDLASIPHPASGLSLDHPYYRSYYVKKVNSLMAKLRDNLSSSDVSDSGSWTDYEMLIRSHPFVHNKIEEHKQKIRSSPYFDYDSIIECYQRHLAGENYTRPLFVLLTVLESEIDLR